MIEQKTAELSRYLVGQTGGPDFSEPSPILHRTDDRELRRRILSLSQSDARKLGIVKSTLHHLRVNANSNRVFTIYGKSRSKLEHNNGRQETRIAE